MLTFWSIVVLVVLAVVALTFWFGGRTESRGD